MYETEKPALRRRATGGRMLTLFLVLTTATGWGLFLRLHLKQKKYRLVVMEDLAQIAAELSSRTGIPYGEALRSMSGVMNYNLRLVTKVGLNPKK